MSQWDVVFSTSAAVCQIARGTLDTWHFPQLVRLLVVHSARVNSMREQCRVKQGQNKSRLDDVSAHLEVVGEHQLRYVPVI